MATTDIEQYLDELAEMVTVQENIQFGSEKEAQRHVEATSAKLHDLLQQSSTMFLEGLKHLSGAQHGAVGEIASQLRQHLTDSKKMDEIVQTQVANNPHSLELFSEAVNSYYDCGDYHCEECVIAVMLTLFPLEPQPLACYGTLLWRRDGINTAAEFYQSIVDLFQNPILDYFTADCFFKSGKTVEAKKLLERALVTANEAPEIYADIAQFIRILLKQC